jgi:HEAT repeat protein
LFPEGNRIMKSSKAIRLGALLVVLAVCFSLLFFHKRFLSNEIAAFSAEEPKRNADPLDLHSFTPEAVPDHIKELSDSNPEVRQKAANALWHIGPRAAAATPDLIRVVKDPSPEVRQMAAKALGAVSEAIPDAVPTLTEALRDPQTEVRLAAATSLAEIWLADKRPARQREREDRGQDVRERTGRKPPPSAEPKKDENEEREHEQDAATGPPVAQLKPQFQPGAKAAVPVLTSLLRENEATLRAAAAKALGETGPLAEPAVGELTKVLDKDPDDDARLRACIALGNIGPGARAAVPVMISSLLHDKFLGVRVNTAGALGQIHADAENVIPALVEACLTDSEPEVKIWSLNAINCYPMSVRPIIQKAIEVVAKDPRYQHVPEVQKRVQDFRDTLKQSGKAQTAAGDKDARRKGR